MKLTKRSGLLVDFDATKIFVAIEKAFAANAVNPKHSTNTIVTYTNDDIQKVTDYVIKRIQSNESVQQSGIVPIEKVQNYVEESLMEHKFFDIAKSYILYRTKRAEMRKNLPPEVSNELVQLAKQSANCFNNEVMREFVFLRSYSRWIPSKGRREFWPETVDRYMNFMHENIGDKFSTKDYEDIRHAILNNQVMPSMRLLQFAGPAARRCNVCIYNCAYVAPEAFKDLADICYLLMSGTGVGFSVEAVHVNQFPVINPRNDTPIQDYVVEDSKEGWANIIKDAMEAWFLGNDLKIIYSKLRPAGTRLKTSGGRSSGPQPLIDLMIFMKETIQKRQGTKLTTLDMYDIICKIGQIVVAGGSRRSSLISLSDLSDLAIRDAKKGNFWLSDSQRFMSNNSAAYNEKPSQVAFMKEWLALAESGTGERGLFSRAGLEKSLPQRRLELLNSIYKSKDYLNNFGSNPCVTGDTWVQTIYGPKQVIDLVGIKTDLIVNGIQYPMESNGFFETGVKEVFEVTTHHGYNIKLTNNHKLNKLTYKTRKVQKYEWIELKDLKECDSITLSDHTTFNHWDGPGTFEEGWLIGKIVGDGGIIIESSETKNNSAYLRFWNESAEYMKNIAVNYINDSIETRSDFTGSHNSYNNTWDVKCVGLYRLCQKYGITDKKMFTNITEKTSSDFQRGLIRGFFDADGSIQGNLENGISVRLSQIDIPRLLTVQRMLSRLGIISTLYTQKSLKGMKSMPDGRGGMKDYMCQDMHELVISKANLIIYAKSIGFHEPAKTTRITDLINSYKRKPNKEPFYDTIKSIKSMGFQPVYDVTIKDVHEFCANGIRAHNCGEILLQSNQFCNLSEVICRENDTVETLTEKVRIATMIGTYQSSLTNFQYISPKWKINQELERLLGVSLTGQWDCPIVRNADILTKLKDRSINVNAEYAKKLGINQSTSVTTCKPSGTVSQVTNSASGVHPRFSDYYIRRIRISATDPLLQLMKAQGYKVSPEVGQIEGLANTYVLDFPTKSPQNAVTVKDISALEQLEYWKMLKLNWAEHSVSVTIYVKPDEWVSVQSWVWNNFEFITGLSFLPVSEHLYQLAPYEEITKEQYEELSSKITRVDFSKLIQYEKSDETDVKRELACAGGVCEL